MGVSFYNDASCSDANPQTQSIMLDVCMSGGIFTCDAQTGAMSSNYYADAMCTGSPLGSQPFSTTCENNAIYSCGGDYFVSKPPTAPTTSAPIDPTDPGCKALLQGSAYVPMDTCMGGLGFSQIYTCTQAGTASVTYYGTSDCTGTILFNTNDTCGTSGDICVPYCDSTELCTSLATIEVYNGNECMGDVLNTQIVVANICGADDTSSRLLQCGANDLTTSLWDDSTECDGMPTNATTFVYDECDGYGNYSLIYSCDVPPTPEPTAMVVDTTDMDNTNDADTTMDGTGETIVDNTQTTDDDGVDPTVDGSAAFEVSKMMPFVFMIITLALNVV